MVGKPLLRETSGVRLQRRVESGRPSYFLLAGIISGDSMKSAKTRVATDCLPSDELTSEKPGTVIPITQHNASGAAHKCAHPHNKRTRVFRTWNRAARAQGSRRTLRNRCRPGLGLCIPWHFRPSDHSRG
jgi:hypothetical protein